MGGLVASSFFVGRFDESFIVPRLTKPNGVDPRDDDADSAERDKEKKKVIIRLAIDNATYRDDRR